MNNYEEWAQLVAKKLKGEADLITAIEKDELDDAGATEAFSRAVLENFLPENFGIGDGRIVDAFGNYSGYFDLIIYNRDFPRIGLRGTHNTFLYESVLACFAIRAKFLRKTFFDAMDACASLADLEANVDKTVLVRLAKKNGLTLGPKKKFIHRDPLHTARFDLIGRPPAFVFGFSGFKTSYRQLQENVDLWIEHREHDVGEVEMKALPAVIATQGVFAWRNAAPLALSNREMLGIGTDDAPVRLIVLQLLYLLNRRLNVTADGYGLKPNLRAYLSQFSPPKFEVGAGEVPEAGSAPKPQTAPDAAKQTAAPVAGKSPESTTANPEVSAAERSHQFEVALDRAREKLETEPKAPSAPVTAPREAAPEPKAEPAAAAPEPPAPEPEPPAARTEPPQPEPAPESAFKQPSPFASGPTTPTGETAAVEPAQKAEFDKPSPFAAAPRSPAADSGVPASGRRPTAKAAFDQSPFASAPSGGGADPGLTSEIPAPDPEVFNQPLPDESDMAAAEPEPSAPRAKAAPETPARIPAKPDVIPPKPPVDFDLTSESGAKARPDAPPADAKPEPVDDDDPFIQTVVMPPPNGGGKQEEAPRNSTDAFIARVKQQLSSPDSTQFETDKDKDKDKEQDPFSSTIPQ